ncbi:serine/threonine-protein kinase PBL34-like [Quercus suber]|uniref:serine/threonine-protein kinase PBL34-like n=1 Tax=Quercus suber TaxID=58331 RepID=UPI0032DE8F35
MSFSSICSGKHFFESVFAGSFGYIAPERARTPVVNEKIDVYSFGVILLELTTGREARYGDEHTSLAKWAWHYIKDDIPIVDALDEEIKEPSYLEGMSSVFILGIICTNTEPSKRPSMKEVVQILHKCNQPLVYGEKIAARLYNASPLLKNSKRKKNFYPQDFTDYDKQVLKKELYHFEHNVVQDPEFKELKSLSELSQWLVRTRNSEHYKLVYRIVRLVLTLPVSTATTERAFSVMKVVKTNLRNKMEDDFLTDSLMLYIEKDIASTFSLDSIVDDFENLKERRVPFS